MTSQRDPAVDAAGCIILVATLLLGCVIGAVFGLAVLR